MSGAKVDMDVDRSHYYPAMNPFVAGFFYPDSKKGDALITPSSVSSSAPALPASAASVTRMASRFTRTARPCIPLPLP